MKELLKQYAAYNVWANQRITNCIIALPEEKQMAEVRSSFNSLFNTLLHMWNAESVWWQRMKLQERIVQPAHDFKGNMQDLVSGLLQQNKQWEEWVFGASDLALEHVFHYRNLKGEQFKNPVFQMLLHIFNHGTYHRGQLITMLRQLGEEKVPETDFIVWTRRR